MTELSGQIDQQEASAKLDDEKFKADQEQALGVLQIADYISRDDQGRVTFDLNKFKSKSSFEKLRPSMGPLATQPEYGGGKWIPTLAHTFKDIKGYSPEDYDRLIKGEQVEAKPLFYTPHDREAALSIDTLKQSQFYMGLWEVGQVPQLPLEYPTLVEGNRSGLSTHEAVTACLIYNPQYGDGERVDGKLLVSFDPEYIDKSSEFVNSHSDDESYYRRPISRDFFKSWGYYGAPGVKGIGKEGKEGALLSDSPADFFISHCPTMVEKGLISPYEDFTITAKKNELGPPLRLVQPNGLVWIDNKKYSLGRKHAGDSVYQVSGKYAAILNVADRDNPQLVKLFSLTQEEASLEELQRPGSSRKVIGKSEIAFLDPTQPEGLSEEDGVLLSNFKDFMDFSQRVAKEGRFNLLELTFKEKSLATTIYQIHGDDPRLWNFVRQYGMDGLRSMMAVEEARKNAEAIWEISEKIDATKVFADVSGIVKTVTAYQEGVRSTLSEQDQHKADEVAHTVMAFTSDMLLALGPVVNNDPHVKGVIDVADVVSTLRSFKARVATMYEEKFGLEPEDDLYQKLLDIYKGEGQNPHVDTVALHMLQQVWLEQADATDKQAIEHVYRASDDFYGGNEELFTSASETTGDTEKELRHFKQYVIERQLKGDFVKGVILDMGCGDGERITRPMAEALQGQAMVVGIDRQLAAKQPEGNMQFVQGDFTKIPLADNSVDLATAHWSVINDLASRKLQLESFNELARVLKEGGEFYFDVPYLEGGEGSWDTAAKEFHGKHPDQPYGMIHATFPNGRNKEFYIYPEKELEALLDQAGFSVQKAEAWRTESGKPRKTIVARLERKVIPQLLAA